jgi:hypothetical protein
MALRSAIGAATAVVLSIAACGPRDRTPLPVVDLVRELSSAEARPSPASFDVLEYRIAGAGYPAIRTTAPSRLTYTLPIPRRSRLLARVSIDASAGGLPPQPLRFRVGVSDERLYEQLAEVLVTPGSHSPWTDLHADLSAYAGWKWSVFYRPERRRWRLILNTDAPTGVPARGVWGAVAIESDRAAAREYVGRAESSNRDR